MSEARGKLIFVNRFFWPDRSATSQILSDVAFHLSEAGFEVEVVTSRQSYAGDEGPYPASEQHRGVRIHRVATPSFGRGNVAGRIADYLGFYISAFLKTIGVARKGDVVIAKTDPPVLSWPIGIAARWKGARQVNWLQDLYPEVAEAFGVLGKDQLLTRIVRKLRDRSLRKAACNIAIGQRMADVVRGRGVDDARIVVIPNMTDDEAVRPVAPSENPLRREWGYDDDMLVVGYSGNLGRAHEIETMLGAAEELRDDNRIRFLVIGGGYLWDRLEQEIAARGLTNIDLKPYQPRDQLRHSLTVPDVQWVSLLPALEGLIVPSKFYGAAASGRPVIFIGSDKGELGDLIPQTESGSVIAVGDSPAFAARLRAYASDVELRAAHGRAARALVERDYNRAAVFAQWRVLAKRLVGD